MNKTLDLEFNIKNIYKAFKAFIKAELDEYGLNATEGIILLKITESPHGLMQEKIVELMHNDKGAIARTMQTLEMRGFVKRTENPRDHRSFLIIATEKARNINTVIKSCITEWKSLALSGLTEDEFNQLLMLSTKLSDALCRNPIQKEK